MGKALLNMLFKNRSIEKEYLDQEQIPTADLYQNLFELDIINKYLGGYTASRKGLSVILRAHKGVQTLMDIGFGGGDSIKELAKYAKSKDRNLFFYGVDLKEDCKKYAEDNLKLISNKELICDDYRNIDVDLLKKIDVIHCSLFLHHLTDEQIVALFTFCRANGCIILANDLHRTWLAYYSIMVLTRLFSRSYLVKNDAPLSVKRGFKGHELAALLHKAGYKNYTIKWSWAFRYILIAVD